jgi:undecaprenyl-diphosphatase
MEILQAILLGIVEGLTEFLPISSTGHLIVAQDMLNYYDKSKLFTVVIQTGAILAVIWFYRRDLWQLVLGLVRRDAAAQRFWLVWVLATIPAGIAGLAFDAQIEAYAVTATVAFALILGGIVIWLIETYRRVKPAKTPHLQRITVRQALLIGLYQIAALVPGVSRSGATIMGGLLVGLDRVTATAFSFYLGIPILLLAGVFKFVTGDISTVEGGTPALIAGLVTSFITALLVIGWLLRFVSTRDFKPFAYYRIIFGLVLLGLVGLGVLG